MKFFRLISIALVLTLLTGLPACRSFTARQPTPAPAALQPDLFPEADTACFFHTIANTVTCLDSSGWHIYPYDKNWTFNQLSVHTHCADGRVYLGGGDRLLALSGDTAAWLRDGPMLGEGDRLACGPGSEIWFAIDLGSIGHFDGSKWIFPAPKLEGSQHRTGFAVAPDGAAWLATEEQIATFDGDQWQVFKQGQDFELALPRDPAAWSVVGIGHTGAVWVGADSGLLRYDGARWSAVGGIDGEVLGVTVGENDQVWAATRNAVYRLDPPAYTPQQVFKFDSVNITIKAMQLDWQGRLWAVTDYGFYIFNESAWMVYTMGNAGLFANTASGLVVLGNGPRLPAAVQKAPGSVSANFGAKSAGKQVQVCVNAPFMRYDGPTPCAGQPVERLATVAADGSVLVQDLPAGQYTLIIQDQINSTRWYFIKVFEVAYGEQTRLGALDADPFGG